MALGELLRSKKSSLAFYDKPETKWYKMKVEVASS